MAPTTGEWEWEWEYYLLFMWWNISYHTTVSALHSKKHYYTMPVPVKSIFAASCYILSTPFFSHFMQMQLTFLQILSFLVGPSFGLPLFLIHLTSRTGSINCYLLEVPHIDLYAGVIITIIIYHPLRARIN